MTVLNHMGRSQCFKELTSNAVLFLMTEVSYMVQVFIASVFATCLFVRFADSNEEGCLRPASVMNGYRWPLKKFYQVNEKVSYSCSWGLYLFGDAKRNCLSDGSWSGRSPHCASSASRNVKLMQDEQIFGVLVDGFKGTCLNSSILSLNNSIYIRVNGFHHAVVLDIYPTIFHIVVDQISYLNINNSFGEHNYENSLSYVDCVLDSIREVFICDFLTLLENPLIRIKLITFEEWNVSCRSCKLRLCEMNIFVENENISLECWPPEVENARWNTSNSYPYPIGTELNVECFDGYESYSNISSIKCESGGQWSAFSCTAKTEKSSGSYNTVLIYAISAGVSLFVILALIVVIFIALKKGGKMNRSQKCTVSWKRIHMNN